MAWAGSCRREVGSRGGVVVVWSLVDIDGEEIAWNELETKQYCQETIADYQYSGGREPLK